MGGRSRKTTPPGRAGGAEKKNAETNGALGTALKVFAVITALSIVVFFAARAFGGMGFTDVEDSARQFVSGTGAGAGYPYQISSADVLEMTPLKSNIAVLTSVSLTVLSSTAKEVARFEHSYSDPAMSVYSGRALVYDKTTGDFTVLNASKIISSGNAGAGVYTASMGKDGSVAFSVKSGSAQSELVVFNDSLEKVFAWQCADEKIFDVAIAPNGKSAALILLGSADAQIYSKLLIMDFDKPEPAAEFVYDGTALFEVLYTSKNTVIAYGNDMKTTITKKTERTDDYKYGSATVALLASADNGKSALVLSQYGNESSQQLLVFDKRSRKLFEKSFDEKIYSVSCTDKYTALLLENRILLLRNSGEQTESFEAGKNGKRIVCTGESVYTLYSSNISKN